MLFVVTLIDYIRLKLQAVSKYPNSGAILSFRCASLFLVSVNYQSKRTVLIDLNSEFFLQNQLPTKAKELSLSDNLFTTVNSNSLCKF